MKGTERATKDAVEIRDSSLQRRVTFAGQSRLFFDGLAAYPPVSRLLLRGHKYDRLGIIHRLLDKAAVTAYDLWECARTGGLVPFLASHERRS